MFVCLDPLTGKSRPFSPTVLIFFLFITDPPPPSTGHPFALSPLFLLSLSSPPPLPPSSSPPLLLSSPPHHLEHPLSFLPLYPSFTFYPFRRRDNTFFLLSPAATNPVWINIHHQNISSHITVSLHHCITGILLLPLMRRHTSRVATMPVIVLLLCSLLLQARVYAQDPTVPTPIASTDPAATTTLLESTTTAAPEATMTAPSTTDAVIEPTSTSAEIPQRTPGPANSTFPAGTVNCFTEPFCGANEECFVLKEGVVCLDKEMNWGYILSRNASGVPAIPSWSGPRSQLNSNCSLFQTQMPDKPGLAMTVYEQIKGSLPDDLLLSRYDQVNTNWYTMFSNCETQLACMMGKCLPRPGLGQTCRSSWQCNPQALGLDLRNMPIRGNTTIRCEYDGGNLSVNSTCQMLRRDTRSGSGSAFSAWHVVIPVVGVLVLIYFGAVIYQRRMRRRKLRQWSRVAGGKAPPSSLLLPFLISDGMEGRGPTNALSTSPTL